MFKRKKLLPDVPIYIMMGGIGENFGGVTSVALHRSSVFAELDDRPIGFLTTSMMHAVDPGERERELKREGRLGEKVRFHNAWFDLSRMTDIELENLSCGIEVPEETVEGLLPFTGELEATRHGDDGAILQIDRFRADGTRYVSDRKDMRERGRPGGRILTAFTRDGRVAKQWDGARFVYHSWLDWLTNGDTSIIIVDSANSANLMFEYRRDHVVVVHTIHSTHVHGRTPGGRGLLASNQHRKYSNLDSFDLVTTLTDGQAVDLKRDGIAGPNLVTMSNMSAAKPINRVRPRDPRSGVVLSRLSPEKRVSHMLDAVGKAGISPSLDIYGHGDEEEHLRTQITEQNLDNSVHLKGYDPQARKQFELASFTLMTSRYEGQGLSLIEAMAHGCIPISYDIKYGPSDTITHGVDGLLVPDGDTDELAAAIDRLAGMTESERTKMRKAAVKRSTDFLPKTITREWGRVLDAALAAKAPVQSIKASAKLQDFAFEGDTLSITVTIDKSSHTFDHALLTWTERDGLGYGRTTASLSEMDDQSLVSGTFSAADLSLSGPGTIDFWVDLFSQGSRARVRIKGAGEGLPIQHGAGELYATKHKSLSLKIEEV